MTCSSQISEREARDFSNSKADAGGLHGSPTQTMLKRASDTKPPIPSTSKGTLIDSIKSEEAREAALKEELVGIRGINQVMESVINSLERAKDNMETVSRTVNDASTLLNTWTRILSQTEHNQRLILSSNWHGASQDISNMENESKLRQQEIERRDIEEAHRREANLKKAEEEARSIKDTSSGRGSRGTRGKRSGMVRGGNSTYTGVGGQGNGRGIARGIARGLRTGGRYDSGIGRTLSSKGRGRGFS